MPQMTWLHHQQQGSVCDSHREHTRPWCSDLELLDNWHDPDLVCLGDLKRSHTGLYLWCHGPEEIQRSAHELLCLFWYHNLLFIIYLLLFWAQMRAAHCDLNRVYNPLLQNSIWHFSLNQWWHLLWIWPQVKWSHFVYSYLDKCHWLP